MQGERPQVLGELGFQGIKAAEQEGCVSSVAALQRGSWYTFIEHSAEGTGPSAE